MFDYKQFKRNVSTLLDGFDCEDVDRAWEIACGTMEVIAKVDKRDDESLDNARKLAWRDFYWAFKDKTVTYTYWGLYEEILYAAMPRGEEMESRICNIGDLCVKGKPKTKKKTQPKKRERQQEPTLRKTRHPHLRVVES
jgi:hypothetical protein